MSYEMKSITLFAFTLTFAFLIAACGPSAEEIATQTADAWTPTPQPTSTPTPVPYDLTLKVEDQEGAPIIGVFVTFNELEGQENALQVSNDSGEVSWLGLPSDVASLSLAGQGYFSGEFQAQVERGENLLSVQLERNPNGLLPKEACGSAENLAYIDDFQDRKAKEWPEIDFATQGWSFDEDESGNIAVVARTDDYISSTMQNFVFENFVWRSKFRVSEEVQGYIQFSWAVNGPPIQYGMGFGYDRFANNPIDRSHPEAPDGVLPSVVNRNSDPPAKGVWHNLEISYFDGLSAIWLDGVEWLVYEDPSPLGRGGLVLSVDSRPGGSIYFDNFSVCELSQGFETIYVPEAIE